MLGSLTGIDIANTVRMMRTLHAGAILIVEGDKDALAYGRVVEPTLCRVVPGFGKASALEALGILEGAGTPGIAAVVDSDFSKITGAVPPSPNAFVTDAHDLETVMIASPALDKVLEEFGSQRKMRGKDIRQTVLENGQLIGYLRFVSMQDGLNLAFENLPFSAFVDKETMRVDIGGLIKTVKNKSGRHRLDERALKARLQDLVGRHNPLDVCCGHDLIGILSTGLRKGIGSRNAAEVSTEVLQRSLRLAYEKAHFSTTQLHAGLAAWPNRQPGFRIV